MDLDQHLHWFEEYVESRIRKAGPDSAPLLIKLEHTRNVLANARLIADAERLDATLTRAAALAALYHDLSRFDQYLVYRTFKDKDSRNHGAWSVKLLKTEARLAGESRPFRLMVQTAIGMHNRRTLPQSVTGPTLLISNVVRDADKLDILRVMDAHLASHKPYNPTVVLGLPDDPHLSAPVVIDAAMSGNAASYADLRSVNDFRVLLGSWFFGMNFRSSRDLFVSAGHAARILRALPENAVYGSVKKRMLEHLDAHASEAPNPVAS